MKIIITLAAGLILSINAAGQTSNENSWTVIWENGDVTYMKDLDRVWIKLVSGSTIKKAKLWDFQKDNGKLVYEKDGSLHDVTIQGIDKIYAGNNSRSILYFDKENNPRIISSVITYDEFTGYSDFKISQKASKASSTIPPAKDTIQFKKINASQFPVFSNTANDTIIKPSGNKIPARITLITSNEVYYKRADVPEGPEYVIDINSCNIIKSSNSIKIIIKQ